MITIRFVFPCLVVLLLAANSRPLGQQLPFPAELTDAGLTQAIPALADQVIPLYQDADRTTYLANLYRLQIAAGRYTDAVTTITALLDVSVQQPFLRPIVFEIYARARLDQRGTGRSFEDAYDRAFRDVFARLSDQDAVEVAGFLGSPLPRFQQDLQAAVDQRKGKADVAVADAVRLIAAYVSEEAFRRAAPRIGALLAEDDARRFVVQNDVLIRTKEGATLSAVVVRPKGGTVRQPAALMFNIYVDPLANRINAKRAALRGYVGVVSDTHGKGLSPDSPQPWDHDARDTYGVIDWISRQPWSDGQVGMYGGSYSGFSQWAAAKSLHSALKTIVPVVAANPGLGLPMQNNVFQTPNYAWNFYVASNKTLDEETYGDTRRWNALNGRWFTSGRPYREIDHIDGTPNPILQRQLQHSAYDRYWQSLTPYKSEFSRIRIPVLTIAGYFDDSQVASVQYLKDHYTHNKNAQHYLVIGPYDHFGTQAALKPAVTRGYAIDPVAQFDTSKLTFEWFDYVMRRGVKPALLKDKINYQVMGANVWRHAPSLAAMSTEMLRLYLTTERSGPYYVARRDKPVARGFVNQTVDLADRKTTHNDHPGVAILARDVGATGPSFLSDPFEVPVSVSGAASGMLRVVLNARDFDFSVALYEMRPDGSIVNLTYYLGRASFAKDMSVRRLLTPGRLESLPFDRTPLTSRQLSAGSRLLVRLNVNKNRFAQVNYGTGKDVSDESIADAKAPLHVQWSTDSYIDVPISR
jgi:uncharacterized protein